MPRPPNIIPSVKLHTALPLDIKAKLDLVLFSELEGRVPQGAYQAFFIARVREFLVSEYLDLAPFLPHLVPGTAVVRGDGDTIRQLRRILEA